MSALVLSPRAQADLDAIWNHTSERWSDAQAERYIRSLWQAMEAVAADPRRAKSCDDIRPGYRKYLAGQHVLFIRETDGVVDIVRILHASMDFERHLKM